MRSITSLILAALAALAMSAGVFAKAPPAAEDCASCHNKDGISEDEDIPIIAGASAFFLENQMLIFKEGARPCAKEEFGEEEHDGIAEDHCDLAKALSEKEITELAAYFAEQPFKSADQKVDEELAGMGAQIHEQRCEKCHSDSGSLALDDAGILAGQWKAYLVRTMQDYKNGDRWQPEKMQPAMEALSEKDIQALAEHYAREGKK
ncbi:cytochrome c-553 [Marinobacter panjinensis]|uniref:Cytochrome c-553 n=1 Tax=Marinobacter panjinensis TaxID=2576384 RepID=A0A4U6R644_9GAMM|nr:c-type cytochrome [Marinobacter panjinensis]MCR8916176.1 c-type cytochrome [Marinobacter panjinensis]TKV68352.1 cytochrome c-553 [Marinobacter panjinensis]